MHAINQNDSFSLKGRIITPDGIREGVVCIKDGIVTDITSDTTSSFNTINTIDVGDSFIAPGFIDLHMHGIHQFLIDNGPHELEEICLILPKYGVTGFLPTVAPRATGKDALFLQTLSKVQSQGAHILGFHLEGPFLKITGSLSANAAGHADKKRVADLMNAAKPYRAIFSISPDLENITDLLPLMTNENTPAFITHTAANVKQTQASIALGAKHATHFYDVFPCPVVEEPGVRPCGVVEAVLADENVSVDFILDAVHVDPIAVKMAMACKKNGPGCVCLITDSNVGAGLEPGRFVFGDSGEIEFAYKGSPARKTKDKTLAGSGLTMDQAIRNAVRFLNIDISEAVKMASANPAKVIGIDNHKGKIEIGYDADITVLNDELEIVQTWVAGKQCYNKHNKMEKMYE